MWTVSKVELHAFGVSSVLNVHSVGIALGITMVQVAWRAVLAYPHLFVLSVPRYKSAHLFR